MSLYFLSFFLSTEEVSFRDFECQNISHKNIKIKQHVLFLQINR